MRAAGIPVEDDPADLVPTRLVLEYEVELGRRGSAPVHVRRSIQRIKVVLSDAKRLADVTPAWVRKALARIESDDCTATTANGYRLAVSGFFNWLVRDERWPSNPCKAVKPARPGEKTRERRALDDDELRRLLAKAPAQRSLVYRLAASSGLRRSELAALRWRDLDLDAATVRARASTSKNRRETYIPLPADTVDALRGAAGPAPSPMATVFLAIPTMPTYRVDLKAAKIPYETPDGVADFHALRVTYATRLARAGVSLVQAQRLMRHRDPKLTANIYTRLGLVDGQAVVAKISLGTGRKAKRA